MLWNLPKLCFLTSFARRRRDFFRNLVDTFSYHNIKTWFSRPVYAPQTLLKIVFPRGFEPASKKKSPSGWAGEGPATYIAATKLSQHRCREGGICEPRTRVCAPLFNEVIRSYHCSCCLPLCHRAFHQVDTPPFPNSGKKVTESGLTT